MNMIAKLGFATLAFGCAASLQAAVSLPFVGAGAEYFSATNGSGILEAGGSTAYAWTEGDYVRQSFADTGLFSAVSITGSFEVETNLFSPLALGLLINDRTVGWIDIDICGDCGEFQTISYSFNFAPIAGDNFDLELRWLNTVPDLDGSISIYDGGTATLSDQRLLVPEPATWAMMLAGFGLVGVTMRRRVVAA